MKNYTKSFIISDTIIRLKNSNIKKYKYAYIINNKINKELAILLLKNGFISQYVVHSKYIKVLLKYREGVSMLKSIKVISTPSRRIFINVNELWKLTNLKPLVLLQTINGLITSQTALKKQVGGEVICFL